MLYRIFAVLLVLLAAACGPTSQQQEPAVAETETTGVSSEDIVLGSHTDLSGPLALKGVGAINGARMRFDEANKAGGIDGRHIRLVVEDNQSDVARATQAVTRLLGTEHIFAMVFAMGDAANEAALAQLSKDGVPNIFPFSSSDVVANSGRSIDFTERPTRSDEMRAAVNYFVKGQGNSKPCVLHDVSGAGKEVAKAVTEGVNQAGATLAGDVTFKTGQADFADAMKQLGQNGCDVVFLGANDQDAVAIVGAAHKQKLTAALVGDDADYGEDFTGLDHKAGEGFYAMTQMARYYPKDDMPPKVRAWWNKYVELYGDEPRVPAMEGYRAADLVVRALESAGKAPTREALVKALEGIGDYTDLFGYHLSFGPERHQGTHAVVLNVVENGKWKMVKRDLTGE